MKKRFYLPSLLIGCMILLSSVVKGSSVPVINTDLQNDTVCSGTPAYFILGASDTSATPGTLTYTWQYSTTGGASWLSLSTGGAFTVSSDSLTVAASMAVSGYKFRVIVSDSAGSDTSFAASLKVDTSDWGTIVGPTAVCLGSSITLSGTVAGGSWFTSNDSATITPSGVVTGALVNGLLPGLDTIYYYFANTCGSGRDTTYITINPTPATGVISGPSIVCKSSSISLTETVTGGVWSRSHAGVDSVDATGVVYALGQGFDTIKYTTTLGTCTASATHPVRVDTFAVAQGIAGPPLTCVGNTIVLTNANVLGTWVWSASNSRATVYSNGNVHGNAYGLDTITYVFTNACNTVTSSTTVQVDTVLYPGVISGPAAVCSGSWIHLTESISGGIWLSSNSSLAVVDASGYVTGVAQGAPLISYIVANGCGISAATHALTVSRLAGVITGSDSVGIGHTITLADSTIGGTWSSHTPSIATVNTSGVVTGVATGTTEITYTVTNICGTSYATKTINVGPAPYVAAIGGVDSVCLGDSILLTDSVGGGSWSVVNSDTSVHTALASISGSGMLHGLGYGLTKVSYSVTNAFGTTTRVKYVFVNQPPVVIVNGPTVVSLGGNYFLFGVPWGGTWTASNSKMGEFVSQDVLLDTFVSGVKYPYVSYGSFVVTHAGADTLTYTVTNSCGTRSATFIMNLFEDNSAPNFTIDNTRLNVYPNPNNGEFTINLMSAVAEDVTVTITNIVGEKVRELNIATNKRFDVKLEQPAGMYLVTAITASGARYNAKITLTK